MKPIIKYQLFCLLLLTMCLPSAAFAADAQTVQGTTYSCYFYTPFSEPFDSDVSFTANGGLSIQIWEGNGFYVPLFNLFTGFYVAVDAIELPEDPADGDDNDTVGIRKAAAAQDLTMSISGFAATPLPFVFGIGVMVLDYSDNYQFWFAGIRSDLGE